jgi:DnaJ-class molecular chaperone
MSNKVCQTCDGQGTFNTSSCCGAEMYGEMTDIGICPECREHTDPTECEDCDGKGYV